jgi:hypothetical protein
LKEGLLEEVEGFLTIIDLVAEQGEEPIAGCCVDLPPGALIAARRPSR